MNIDNNEAFINQERLYEVLLRSGFFSYDGNPMFTTSGDKTIDINVEQGIYLCGDNLSSRFSQASNRLLFPLSSADVAM